MNFFRRTLTKPAPILLLTGAVGTTVYLCLHDHFGNGNHISSLEDSGKPYLEIFKKHNLRPVEDNTTDEVFRNILIQRIYPNHRSSVEYKENQIFPGSPVFSLTGKEYKTDSDNKKIFILDKVTAETAKEFKESCLKALKTSSSIIQNKNGKITGDENYYKLKEWCTIPTIRDVLARHKFNILNTKADDRVGDYIWKEVIGGGWFKSDHKNQQSFISESELNNFLEDKKNTGINSNKEVTIHHIEKIKEKCRKILEKPFKRASFPAPKEFLNKLSEEDKKTLPKTDEFQDAALFCSKPLSAESYIKNAMQGKIKTTIDESSNEVKNDFCLITGKKADDYKLVKTNDPFEGKTFWCAVRILYDRNKNGSGKK